MTRALLERLRFGGDLVDRVTGLVANHMYTTADAVSDAGIRRFIRRVGRTTWTISSPAPRRRRGHRPAAPRRRRERALRSPGPRVLGAGHPMSIADLQIKGEEVIGIMRDMGVVGADFQGDGRVGAALRACLEEVLDDPGRNEPQALRSIVRSFFDSKKPK